MRCDADAFGARPDGDPFVRQNGLDLGRQDGILASQQGRAHLDHRDGRPEASVHLRELEPDVAAADHHEVPRDLLQRKHVGARQPRDFVEAWPWRRARAAADVEKDPVSAQAPFADGKLARPHEARVTAHDLAAFDTGKPFLERPASRFDEIPSAPLDRGEVDGDGAGRADSVVGSAPRHVSGVGAGHHRLGRRAAHIEACAADQMPLDDGDALAGAGEPGRQRRRRLSGADDDGVEILGVARGHRAKVPGR